MKKSPVYPKYETCDYGFDPQVDFSQFLEEARQHARAMNQQNSEEAEARKGRSAEEIKKSKKSWKKYVFKWWKSDTKKSDSSSKETESSSHISRPRKGQLSGPIYRAGGPAEMKPRRQTSGPITNLFKPSNRMENETAPYMCLDETKNPNGVKAYGPIYLVT